ncbi:hypothetical protein NIES4071_00020 [Calothrix sp. NIES-4071]|nr:hypothetical protein NIES4071_00020 [Calothrix sp. NIES-4071]BAZ54349.1 hypothetical protein NIES4105_00020 [Calothrix sp. NIES-4105]
MLQTDERINREFEKLIESSGLIKSIRIRLQQFHMNNSLTVEDVLSEVFLRLYRTHRSGKSISNLEAWVRTTSFHYIMEESRIQNRNISCSIDLVNLSSDELIRNFSYSSADLEKNEEIDKLNNSMNKLKPENQKILIWRFIDELSWYQIAELLSKEEGKIISESAARKRGERAMNELRSIYNNSLRLQSTNEIEPNNKNSNEKKENKKSDKSEDIEEFYQELQYLNPVEQKIITWRFVEKLTWSEITELLSQEEGQALNVSTIRKRGERIMHKLKDLHNKQLLQQEVGV